MRNINFIMSLKYLNFLIILLIHILPIKVFSTEKSNNLNFNTKNEFNSVKQLKSEYILGSGDYLNIYFKGLNLFTNTYMISLEGYLMLPELGDFYASGLTLVELKNELIEKYKEYMIDPSLEITIRAYRPVSVYISGEVKNPGLYTINYLQSDDQISKPNQTTVDRNIVKNLPQYQLTSSVYPKIFDSIKGAMGVTNNADLSNILVIRENSKTQGGGKIKANVDLLSMLLNGDQTQNIRIFDGDNIIIPKSNKVIKEQILAINKTNISPEKIIVYVNGNVENSGPATLKKGSSLIQAIASTGGKKLMSGKVEFIRFNDNGTTIRRKFRYNQNAEINSTMNPILMDGDIINVNRTILGATTEVLSEISNPIFSGFGIYSIFSD